MNRFHKGLLLLTIACVALMTGVHALLHKNVNPWSWGALAFFLSLTLFLNWLGDYMMTKGSRTFLNFVYGSTFIRFIFSIFFIVIYLIVNEVVDKYFIFTFGLLYLFYTAFEIFHLVTKLRAEK